uniref:SHSP domain-containing protein n=1 Tax=Strigamia maritima TaxID=126957 RepID=T1IVC5_STRMM
MACGGCAKKRGTVCNGPDLWTVTVDVPDYQPNELCVKVMEKCVEVRGKKSPKVATHRNASQRSTIFRVMQIRVPLLGNMRSAS